MLKPGTSVLGRYTLSQLLRKGPLAHTWRIQDAHGNDLLLKHLTLSAMPDWKALELLEREAETLKHLSHPQIPQLVDFVREEVDGDLSLYIVTTYIPAPSLEQRIQAGERFDVPQVTHIATQALEILQYLHSYNPPVIHRDLKPANLLLDDQGQLYVVDFGAVLGRFAPQGGSTIVGTYGYMAPEQFSGRAVPASDLYSLGATLVHLLSGKAPAELPAQGLRLDYHAHVAIDATLRQWLDRLLAPEPADRFASAAQALQALQRPQTLLPTRREDYPSEGVQIVQEGERLHLTLKPTPTATETQQQLGIAITTIGVIGMLMWIGNPHLYDGTALMSERLLAWGPFLSWIGALLSGVGILVNNHQQRQRVVYLALNQGQYQLSNDSGILRQGPITEIQGLVPVQVSGRLNAAHTAFKLQALDAQGELLFDTDIALPQAAIQRVTEVLLPHIKPSSGHLLKP